MKLILRVLLAVFITCSTGVVVAEQGKPKAQSFSDIRADILATITSINEIRLIMINSDLNNKNNNKKVDNETFTRLTSNIKSNNTTVKKLTNELKSNNIRLSILESATFSKADNNFNDYITLSSKKIFNVNLVQTHRGSVDCDATTDTYRYLRTPNDNFVDIVETITRHELSGKVCFERDVIKRKTATELLYLSSQNKIYNDYSVNDIATYTDPVKVLVSTMEKGKSFGSGGTIKYQSNGLSNTLVFNKVSTLLDTDVELTLTVNEAEKTYFNCIIIGTRSNSTVSTEWYCPGDGLVKRIAFFPGVKNKPSRSEIITLKYIAQY